MAAKERTLNLRDLREQPAYLLAEAARYLRLPSATLRAWTFGRGYPTAGVGRQFRPLIHPSRRQPPALSFWNLIEAHVLRALRTEHGVPLKELRQALEYAEHKLGIERLLLRQDLRSKAGQIFLERYGALINLSASGPLAMRQVLDQHLNRVTWDQAKFPVRLHPFISVDSVAESRAIAIDPGIAFGRPVLIDSGISTAAIVARIDVATDYGMSLADVTSAILYERAA